MADISLVVKIPEEVMEYIKSNGCLSVIYIDEVAKAIINGIPLPKGHGSLIDGDRFDVISYQHTNDDFDNGVMWLAEQIDNAPTIIEADKESEGNNDKNN